MPRQNGIATAFDTATGGSPESRKALFQAIRAGDTAEVLRQLQEYPAVATWQEPFGPNDKPYAEDDTPLMAAAQARRSDIVKILLAHGAEATINRQNSRGYTALMYAAWQNADDAASALLWHGANTLCTSEQGQDAVMLARIRGHDDLARTIEAHRSQTEGPAAAHKGISHDITLMKPPTVRKRTGAP